MLCLRTNAAHTIQTLTAMDSSASDAIDRRRQYLLRLDAKEESLTTTGDALADIETCPVATSPCSIDGRSFDELLDSWNYLESLRGRCERLPSER